MRDGGRRKPRAFAIDQPVTSLVPRTDLPRTTSSMVATSRNGFRRSLRDKCGIITVVEEHTSDQLLEFHLHDSPSAEERRGSTNRFSESILYAPSRRTVVSRSRSCRSRWIAQRDRARSDRIAGDERDSSPPRLRLGRVERIVTRRDRHAPTVADRRIDAWHRRHGAGIAADHGHGTRDDRRQRRCPFGWGRLGHD